MPIKKETDDNRAYVCCQCGQGYNSLSYFYKVNSGMYASLGYIPVCKTCIGRLLDVYSVRYVSAKKGLQRICMLFDLYYKDNLFEKSFDGHDVVFGSYMRLLNMTQYRGKTFDHTIRDGFSFEDIPEVVEAQSKKSSASNAKEDSEKSSAIDEKDIEKWGDGFLSADYEILNAHYKYLKNANPNCDSNQEIFINDLCYTHMLKMRALREGSVDNHNKLTEQYRKTFSQAGLKTIRDSSANEDFTIGVNAELIEKYTPAEYYKNKELYRDFDDIGGYFERFILRPLRNLMHGTTDRDHEFYVKEEEDVNELTED